jgi:hypothetical protein
MVRDYVGDMWELENWLPHLEDELRMQQTFEHVIEGCQCEGRLCRKHSPNSTVLCVGMFHRDNSRKDGLTTACKLCRNAYHKEYRSRAEVQEQERVYRQAYGREYHLRNRDRILAQKRAYNRRPEVQAHLREYHKTYDNRADVLQRNRERGRRYYQRSEVRERYRVNFQQNYSDPEWRARKEARNKAYYSRDEVRERMKARNRAYDKARRSLPGVQEREHAYRKVYYSRPEVQEKRQSYEKKRRLHPAWPERRRAKDAHRRARKNGAPGSYTIAQIREQLKRQRYCCYYLRCGQSKFPKDKTSSYGYRFHIEHVVPLSRTEHAPRNDMSNIVLACEDCNLSKRNKLPHEWIEGGRLF